MQLMDVETASFEDFGIDFITQNLSARQEKKARKKDAKGRRLSYSSLIWTLW